MNFEALTEFYFADLLLVICNFLAVLASRKVKVTGSLRIIDIYVSISFAFNLAVYLLGLFLKEGSSTNHALYVMMNTYTVVECTLIFLFIRNELVGKRLKNVLDLIFSMFVAFWLYILIWHSEFLTHSTSQLSGIESFTIVLLCVISFNAMIKRQKISDLIKTPKFFVMMGILGYFSYAIPFFLGMPLVAFFSPAAVLVFDVVNLILLSAYFLIIRKGFYAIF